MTLPNAIPEYNFHKTKYGAELLIDIVALKNIKKYLPQKLLHRLTYYDITFITEGEGHFSINEQEYPVKTRDVIFTRPGDYRQWDVKGIKDGVALIFEEEFLLTFFNDMNFLKNIAFFNAQGNRALFYSTRKNIYSSANYWGKLKRKSVIINIKTSIYSALFCIRCLNIWTESILKKHLVSPIIL